jgi:DNA repair protein RecO (recombination protein O)
MRWESEGIILGFNNYNEKSYILDIFTKEHGRHKGLIRGIHSKNLRSVIEPGNEVKAFWSGRLETHLGNFKVEPIKSWSSFILNNKNKLSALSSLCSLISSTMAEKQPNDLIYNRSRKIIQIMTSKDDQWIKEYINWELDLLSEIGYGIDLSSCVVTEKKDGLMYVSPTSGRAVTSEGAGIYRNKLIKLPAFILLKECQCSREDIINGLELTEHFLRKRFFEPNNLNFPQSRNRLKEMFSNY